AKSFLSLLAAHARRASWVITSRVDPSLPELAGMVRRLEPMADADLVRLARTWAPTGTPADRNVAVRAASGSPWRLLRIVTSRAECLRDELDGEGPATLQDLQTLAIVRDELPLEVARLLVPERGALARLRAKGFLESGSNGVRLHDAARPAVENSMDVE